MENIKEIIGKVLKDIRVQQPTIQTKIQDVFQRVLTHNEFKKISFGGYKEGRVLVLVDSSAMIYQMNLQKTKLLKALKNEAPEVNDILFKLKA